MPKVPIDRLEGGMRLLRPVTNRDGTVIVAQDVELTERLIERLMEMGINGLYIKGMSEPLVPKEQMLAQLDTRFRTVESAPYMDLLKRVVREHIEDLYEQC